MLSKQGIELKFKLKGQSDEVQGISFTKGEYSFKGSEVDRSFSFSKLDVVLSENGHSTKEHQTQQFHKQENEGDGLSFGGTIMDIASGFGGLLTDLPNHPNQEDEYNTLKKRKKKKKQPKIRR